MNQSPIESGLDALPSILLVPEIAKFLDVSHATVYRLIQQGEIKAFKEGVDWNIAKADLKAYIESHGTLACN